MVTNNYVFAYLDPDVPYTEISVFVGTEDEVVQFFCEILCGGDMECMEDLNIHSLKDLKAFVQTHEYGDLAMEIGGFVFTIFDISFGKVVI